MNNFYDKYLKYKNKYLQLKNGQKGGASHVELMLFKANWCGHCTRFKNTWEELKKDHNKKLELIEYDIDQTMEKKYFQKYGVDSFPTLILKKNDTIIEYKNAMNKESITKFINQNLV
jgi:thiol-disulfide isomerase/thioredoxin